MGSFRGFRYLEMGMLGSSARLVNAAVWLVVAAGCNTRVESASESAKGSAAANLNVPALEQQLEAYDAAAAQLGGAVEVNLNLANCGITDDQLAALPMPENTRTIDLMHAKVTDDGLIHLKRCKRLKSLSLVGVPITDAGLEHLRGFPELESVDLRHTRVTTKAQLAFTKFLRQQSFDRTKR